MCMKREIIMNIQTALMALQVVEAVGHWASDIDDVMGCHWAQSRVMQNELHVCLVVKVGVQRTLVKANALG